MADAVASIGDGAVVYLGGNGAINVPDLTIAALAERYERTGQPRDLTIVHTSGLGDQQGAGTDRLALPGMIKRTIFGHYGMTPKLAAMALSGEIEAYNFPQGVLSHLMRSVAGGNPGILSRIGIGTFVDPRLDGGKVNERTTEELVRRVDMDGVDWLYYAIPLPDVAIVRGSTADGVGNLTMEYEAGWFEMLSQATAARNHGGITIAQVGRVVPNVTLDPRQVKIPGHLVDVVVVDEMQSQSLGEQFNPAYCGEERLADPDYPPQPLDERLLIARRAARELEPGQLVNVGFGMSDGVPGAAQDAGLADSVTFTTEQGAWGGWPVMGVGFGAMVNPSAIVDAAYQFDFYQGGGLDIAFLGLAQADAEGNVNVSRFGKILAGCGGFIDITQSARKIVFCGSFSVKAEVQVAGAGVTVHNRGVAPKFVKAVEQVTFNGLEGVRGGQRVLFVTERAVFELTPAGMELVEIAPGVDLERDVLAAMEFKPLIRDLRPMPEDLFADGQSSPLPPYEPVKRDDVNG